MFIREVIKKAQAVSEKLSREPEFAEIARETMRILLDARGIITLERINEEAMNVYLTNMLLHSESQAAGIAEERLAPAFVSKWVDDNLRILTDYYFSNTFTEQLADLVIKYSKLSGRHHARIIEGVYQELRAGRSSEELSAFPEKSIDSARSFIEDIKVNLIREYLSDHLLFIGIAKKYLTLDDLISARKKIFGKGKIGGKAAGMLLAKSILCCNGDSELNGHINVPDFYVLGSELSYEFLIQNGLLRYRSYKYKDSEQIESDFKRLQEDFRRGKFHPGTRAYFTEILERLNGAHFVARSSSRLEDAIGFSFAGKYTSVFCPNQGSREEQLENLERAVREIYISMYNPAVIAYRAHNNLLDYEERIAVLIQKVTGRTLMDTWFFPTFAGVGFSINPYCWNKKIKKEDGMLRIVMGFGSRAVERVGDDYARIVPLSAPAMRPEVQAKEIRKYSQKFVDVMNLKSNSFESVSLQDISKDFDDPSLGLLISVDQGDHLAEPVGVLFDREHTVLTFSRLLKSTSFPATMKKILQVLEKHIGGPVDIEFTVEPEIIDGKQSFRISLVQCRKFNWRAEMKPAAIPARIADDKKFFYSTHGVPNGEVRNVQYVIYVDPRLYLESRTIEEKHTIAKIVSLLNRRLSDRIFILMGPGRWGSTNVNLGVKVAYGDISNTRMLVEIAYEKGGVTPEVSFGTHFFLDLVEGKILALPLYPDREGSYLNLDLLSRCANSLASILPEYKSFADTVRVVDVAACSGEYIQVRLNGEESIGVAYLAKKDEAEKIREDIVLLPM